MTINPNQSVWWGRHAHALPKRYQQYISDESRARAILSVVPGMIDDLLQTQLYAETIADRLPTEDYSAHEKEAHVAVQMGRQGDVLRQPDPPKIITILGEAAIRTPVGSSYIHLEQLMAVDRMLRQKGPVRVGILPFSAKEHLAIRGGFTIMQFEDDPEHDLEQEVWAKTVDLDIVVAKGPAEVAPYRRHFNKILEKSEQNEQASSFIRNVVQELYAHHGEPPTIPNP